ncbi:MAG TPA: M90 family metallopeptidase [Marinobacter sp.]|nr:M90 family metallopeptidase [Marinobacter sp.]
MFAPLVFAIVAVLLVAGSLFYLFFYRSWRRQRALRNPFPARWRRHLQISVPFYSRLSESHKARLENLVQLFLSEKSFYGCAGFEVDDRVRVTIAGHACTLLLERDYSDFDEVRSILVYPDIYRVRDIDHDGLVVSRTDEARAGEAWEQGRVILAWSQCELAVTHPDGPHNVILHEFAHQLDYLDGTADGAPPLRGDDAVHWQHTMSKAWTHLQDRLEQDHTPWLDPYGATEPAEFFAVLTEAFYQQPAQLRQAQPEVYEALRRFYRLDPEHMTPYHPGVSGA